MYKFGLLPHKEMRCFAKGSSAMNARRGESGGAIAGTGANQTFIMGASQSGEDINHNN